MASAFNGWGTSWGATWDRVTNPNAMYGTAVMRFAATGTLVDASIPAPPPENGPSGGANWLRGYKPAHDYSPKRRRSKRDELLICRA